MFCLDGDGAMLMHMGSIANFKHVILNNGVHDSVGGMATAGSRVSFTEIVKSCAYSEAWRVERADDIAEARAVRGPVMLEMMVKKNAWAGP